MTESSIQEELERIKGNKALLLAEDVVEWAKSHEDSALYSSIEWDDNKAANGYRIWQVRRLIALHIVSEPGVRKFVSLSIDRTKPHGGYRDIDEVIANDELRGVLLRDALHDFQRVSRKHEHLEEFAKVGAAINTIAAKIEPEEDAA